MSAIRVRVLTPEDAIAVRDIRLEGLRVFPAAFGNSWEEESIQPLHFWVGRLEKPTLTWFGAEIGDDLAGLTVVSLNSGMKLSHNAEIGAVYVRERFHRRGVAQAMMQSAMDHLAKRATNVTLHVSANNAAARKLYESFGFVVCGQLDGELNVDGSFFDELMMRKRFF